MPLRHIALCSAFLLLGLGACSSQTKSPQAEEAAAPSPAPTSATAPTGAASEQASEASRATKTETEFADALVAPLADLNLVRTPIPPYCKRRNKRLTHSLRTTVAQACAKNWPI